MLKVDPSLNHIPAGREHVVALFESINQPLVNIPGHGTAPTYAFVLGTRNDQGHFMTFVYLTQMETGAVVVYVCEPRSLTREQYKAEESEAIRFVESMGFLIDNVHFPTLPPHEQDAVMERSALFRPPRLPERPMVPASPPPLPPTPLPTSALPSSPPPASIETDALFGGLSDADSEVFRRAGASSVPSSSPSNRPQEPAARAAEPLSAEAKARLGRLLGLFSLGIALTVGGTACKTGRSEGGENARTAESHVDLGNQQLARGRWPDAVRTFELVLEEQDDHKDALRGLGLAYLNLDRLEQAEGYYRRAIESDPKWSIPKNELAVVLMETGKCDEAEELLEQVLKDIFYATPEFAEHNLARALSCQGKTDEAMKRLENLVLKRPYFCLGYLTLAQVASEARAYEKTIKACDEFVLNCEENERIREQVSPEHSAQCYLKKGLAYAQLGDVESARASFERCQSTGPNGRECRRSLALLPP